MKEILVSYQLSLQRFEEILQAEKTIANRDSAIKRFELTIELAWKVLQKYLREEQIICQSPKQCFKDAFKLGLITDNEFWIQMMEDRNLTVHTYDEAVADQVYQRLNNYLPLLKKLYSKLELALQQK